MKNYSLSIRYGLVISGLLIAYFLILSLVDWHTNPLFSLFNGVITGFGIYEVIKARKLREQEKFTYSDGFTTGLVTGFIAVLSFTIFFAMYAGNISQTYLDELTVVNWNGANSIGAVLFTVALSGFTTVIVFTLTFMQLFKPSWNPKCSTAKDINDNQKVNQQQALEI